MAQFDVHRNTGRQSEQIPYVVIVQSALYDSYRRRVVVPLVRGTVLRSAVLKTSRINPVFTVENMEVVLHPLEMVSVAFDQVAKRLANCRRTGRRLPTSLVRCLPGPGNELRWVPMVMQT